MNLQIIYKQHIATLKNRYF